MFERSLARHVAILGVRYDGANHFFRVAALAQDRRSSRGMFFGGAVRVIGPALVVEVMQQGGESPEFFLGAGLSRIGAHAGLYSQRMFAQAFVLCVFT